MNDETKELLEYVYQTVEMGKYSCDVLMKDLHDKDNKIKDKLKDILGEYERFYEYALKLIKKENVDVRDTSSIAKMNSSFHMKKDVMVDNSDSAMADMLIKGLSMGSLEMSRKIEQYEKSASKKVVSLAKDVHKFQEKEIDNLKKFL